MTSLEDEQLTDLLEDFVYAGLEDLDPRLGDCIRSWKKIKDPETVAEALKTFEPTLSYIVKAVDAEKAGWQYTFLAQESIGRIRLNQLRGEDGKCRDWCRMALRYAGLAADNLSWYNEFNQIRPE